MIVTRAQLFCDSINCAASFPAAGSVISGGLALRHDAIAAGWRRLQGTDLCPQCAAAVIASMQPERRTA